MEQIDWIPFEKRYYYPGMAPLDRDIWERFIETHPDEFEECAYNVAVGAGTPMDTIVSPDTGGDINRLYQRKIDVIGRVGKTYVVIEIGPRASTAKVGQVKGYTRLLQKELPRDISLNMLLLTDAELPEMRELADAENVQFIVV